MKNEHTTFTGHCSAAYVAGVLPTNVPWESSVVKRRLCETARSQARKREIFRENTTSEITINPDSLEVRAGGCSRKGHDTLDQTNRYDYHLFWTSMYQVTPTLIFKKYADTAATFMLAKVCWIEIFTFSRCTAKIVTFHRTSFKTSSHVHLFQCCSHTFTYTKIAGLVNLPFLRSLLWLSPPTPSPAWIRWKSAGIRHIAARRGGL